MRSQHVQQVLALEDHLDRHDQFLRASKAQYLTYAADKIEDLDFQTDLVKQALSAKQLWAAELATGSGKSIIGARIAGERLHDGPVIYVSPSAASIGDVEGGVINKFARTFATRGQRGRRVMLGAINELSRANDVSFMTPRVLVTLLRREPARVSELLKRASCFILDEAHHFPNDEQGDLAVFGELYKAAATYVRDGLTVAMTGTWERLDRKRVMGREHPDVRLTVQDAVNLRRCPELYGIQVITDVRAKKASSHGDLYDFHLSGEERVAYLAGVVDCMHTVYRRYPVPFAGFAQTVSDATAIAIRFNEVSGLGDARGLIVLSTHTPMPVRMQAINDIIAKRRIGYVTCAVGEEAIDIPPLEVVHLIRRTRSRARNGQAVGRALRVWPTKRRALVIDYQTMLEGIQDKFLGLSCDDFREYSGSRVARGLNGGPLVCQANYPQGQLVGMSMGEERAVVCINVSSKEHNQRALLKLARESAPRPKFNTSLGRALTNYTTRSSKVYDAAFSTTLFGLCSDWATSRYASADKKQQLRALAQNGQKRPSTGSLGRAAKRYFTISSKSYDQTLTDEIRQLRPDWFYTAKVSSITAYKQGLIERARDGAIRPSGQAWNRIKCLMRTDTAFKRALLQVRPDWNVTRKTHGNKLKAQLRQLATSQATKPSGLLAEAFSRYCTRPSSGMHDVAFTAEMQQLCPEWFTPSATLIKQELLARARRNDPKLQPRGPDSRLYWKLWGYTRVGHKTYDASFAADLFSLRPDWRFQQRREARPLLKRKKEMPLCPPVKVDGWDCHCGCTSWQMHRQKAA